MKTALIAGGRYGWRGAQVFPVEYFDASISTINMTLTFSASGSIAYNDAMTIGKLLSIASVGAASMTKNIIFGGGGSVRRAFGAIKARLSRFV